MASWRYGPEQINFKIGGMVQRVQRNARGLTPKGQVRVFLCACARVYVFSLSLSLSLCE